MAFAPKRTLESHVSSYHLSYIAIIAAVYLAWLNRFIQDDAFISLRYARNLAEGHGLVWQPDHYVQGYTNFLWTIILSIPFSLDIDPIAFSHYIGVFLFFGGLLAFLKAARLLLSSDLLCFCLTLLLCTNYSVLAHATGGLETSLHFLLLMICLYFYSLIFTNPAPLTLWFVLFSLGCSLLLLNRLDSLIFISVLSASILFAELRWARPKLNFMKRAAAIICLPLLTATVYLLWAEYYYGSALPNTFYAKSEGITTSRLLRGLYYIYFFLKEYALFTPLAVLALLAPRLLREELWAWFLALITLWMLYIILIGGGFMEFRFFVPILPFLLLLFGRMWQHLTSQLSDRSTRVFTVFFAGVLVTASALHARTFTGTDGISSAESLEEHLYGQEQQWVEIGTRLGELFPGSPPHTPVIAIEPAGAIPFYSDLTTVDTLGLNDAWVARNGMQVSSRPGHQLRAPVQYLIDQHVNLVIGHPLVRRSEFIERRRFRRIDFGLHIGNRSSGVEDTMQMVEVVGLRLSDGYEVAMAYLRKHPMVDREIARGNLRILQRGLPLD